MDLLVREALATSAIGSRPVPGARHRNRLGNGKNTSQSTPQWLRMTTGVGKRKWWEEWKKSKRESCPSSELMVMRTLKTLRGSIKWSKESTRFKPGLTRLRNLWRSKWKGDSSKSKNNGMLNSKVFWTQPKWRVRVKEIKVESKNSMKINKRMKMKNIAVWLMRIKMMKVTSPNERTNRVESKWTDTTEPEKCELRMRASSQSNYSIWLITIR